jgi:parvulin-like peptidyl-prolyl isomerase
MKNIWFLLVVTLVFAAGCGKNAITVDDVAISKTAFEQALKERGEMHKGVNAKVDDKMLRKSVADELIAQALLLKEAKGRKITATDEEVKKTVEAMRGKASEQEFAAALQKKGLTQALFAERVKDQLLVSKLATELVKDDSVTEAEMKEFYTKSQVPFLTPEKSFVKIVQFMNDADSQAALQSVKKGQDFDAMADAMVKEKKATATDYGWVSPEMFSKEIAMAMKSAKLNTVYGPYKGKDGSPYLFRVKERKASEVIPFDDAKAQIRNMLLNQKRQQVMTQLIETQKQKAKIKVNIPLS